MEHQTPAGWTPAAAAEATAPKPSRVEDRVTLHAIPVDREDVRALLIEKRVEVDREHIVNKRPVAVGSIRSHDARIGIVRVEAKVDVRAVVGDVDLGRLGHRGPVKRALLHKLRDSNRVVPDGIVQLAVDAGRRLGGARRPNGLAPGQRTGLGGSFGFRRIVTN